MNNQLLTEMITQGYVVKQSHPTASLCIYNYTAKAQYDAIWNEVTLMCRGLITDHELNILARPFNKFFNYSEVAHTALPNLPFEVYEKLDGSLGILYWLNDRPYIATRGSFTSDQAIKGTHILMEKYGHLFSTIHKDHTYLFEIIYPENRIVVDYGATEDLILTAIIETSTGNDLPIENTGFTTVKKYENIKDFKQLHLENKDNHEGYVVKFANDYRIKIKFEEYVRLHRIITNVSTISIWEFLAAGQNIETVIEQVPDEFYKWVKATISDLQIKFKEIEDQCRSDFKRMQLQQDLNIVDPTEKKKAAALYILTCKYPHVLFSMYNNKPHEKIIWKMLRPTFSKPFKNLEENEI